MGFWSNVFGSGTNSESEYYRISKLISQLDTSSFRRDVREIVDNIREIRKQKNSLPYGNSLARNIPKLKGQGFEKAFEDLSNNLFPLIRITSSRLNELINRIFDKKGNLKQGIEAPDELIKFLTVAQQELLNDVELANSFGFSKRVSRAA